MKLPRFSVRRPIFTTMVTLILVILGSVSLSRLQIDMLPDIELPTLTIRTDYEGASPEVMERLVTRIIEEIVAVVPGVEEITSTSSEGRSTVRVSSSGSKVCRSTTHSRAAAWDDSSSWSFGRDHRDRPGSRVADVATSQVTWPRRRAIVASRCRSTSRSAGWANPR